MADELPFGLGNLPSEPDDRDYPLEAVLAPPLTVPLSVELPAFPVYNQGTTPECVAFSGALDRTIDELGDEKRTLRFNAPDLYSICKQRDGNTTAGTSIRQAVGVLMDPGAEVATSPDPTEVGKRRKITAYARLWSVAEIKAALAAGSNVWIASAWFNSWFNPVNGILPRPDYVRGGHAYQCVGYDDAKSTPQGTGAWLCQNSWGTGWALSGRFWMPYQFITSVGDRTDDHAWEAWVTTDVLGDYPLPTPPTPTTVTYRFGGQAKGVGTYKVISAANVRSSPYVKAGNIVQKVAVGYQFKVYQTTYSGTLVNGSRAWRGNIDGTRWMHRSVLTKIS